MKPYAIILCVLAGCSTTTAIPAPGTHTPLIASVAGLVAASDGAPTPQPPGPAPAGVCANCKGTGKLGDGTITVNCPVCGGDGRTDNEPPPKVEPPKATPVDPVPKIETYQDAVRAFDGTDCPSGQCTPATRQVEEYQAPQRRGLFRRRGG